MKQSRVSTASLQHLLALIDPDTLSDACGSDGLSDKNHYYQVAHSRTIEAEGNAPTVFTHESSVAEEKVKAWIAVKEALGFKVHFTMGQPSTGDQIAVCWTAVEHLKRGGTIYRGSIAMDGEEFCWG